MREWDKEAVEAFNDDFKLNEFIIKSQPFIMDCAYKGTGKYIDVKTDEWATALEAFNEAIKAYEYNKGSFASFAKLIIKRRLIDDLRKNNKYINEVSVDPGSFDINQNEDSDGVSARVTVFQKSIKENTSNSIKTEIEAINQRFFKYGFTFIDLSKCSPKAKKTRISCAKAVISILENQIALMEIKKHFRLPIALIEKKTKVPRKILERHRKYIIAAVEILSGDYPYLAEYLRFIKEEMKK